MTTEFTNMLHLFGAAAIGKEIKTEYCKNLSKIRELAISQEIWDVIYSALRGIIEDGSVLVPPEVYARLEQNFTANVALNIRRVEFNMQTVRTLEENGIRCCVLKGTTVARLYAMPETRISSDVDILIDGKNERKTVKILTSLGYECEDRSKHDHHIKAHHKTGGLLEIHVALHSVPTSDIIFNDEVHYEEEFMLLNDGIYSLGANDTLLYLSAHLIKHLINDATGIRQMMDLLLYMIAYEDKINWDKYNNLMKKLGYDTLIRVIKGIGNRFFGMNFPDGITEGSGLEELLEDCEIGGAFGHGEKERSQFYSLYTKRRSGNGTVKHLLYRLFTAERSVWSLIFPPKESLQQNFHYAKKYPVLIPIAWVNRFFVIFKRGNGVVTENNKENEVIARRMKMVEKLGMLK